MATPSVRITLSLAFILVFALTPDAKLGASEDRAAATAVGDVVIDTNPHGATVYVDGVFAGRTPLSLKRVSVGDHRVRVVKLGYLENARVVTVAPGQTKSVAINLTRHAGASAADGQVSAPPSGGGGLLKNKWFWVVVAGAGGGGTAAYLLTRNSPPNPGTIGVSPTGIGMAGVTTFSFSSQGASDPDGDSLTYEWNFGDGSTGAGATVTHVYNSTGARTVTLNVSDGKKPVAAPNANVNVGQNLTATWTGGRENQFGCGINITLTQNGNNLSGTMTFAGGCTGSISGVIGSVNPLTHPATVTWQSPPYTFRVGTSVFADLNMSFSGTTNGDGGSMTGSLRLRQQPGTFDQSYPATYTR